MSTEVQQYLRIERAGPEGEVQPPHGIDQTVQLCAACNAHTEEVKFGHVCVQCQSGIATHDDMPGPEAFDGQDYLQGSGMSMKLDRTEWLDVVGRQRSFFTVDELNANGFLVFGSVDCKRI